jgi:hypothetical protein
MNYTSISNENKGIGQWGRKNIGDEGRLNRDLGRFLGFLGFFHSAS